MSKPGKGRAGGQPMLGAGDAAQECPCVGGRALALLILKELGAGATAGQVRGLGPGTRGWGGGGQSQVAPGRGKQGHVGAVAGVTGLGSQPPTAGGAPSGTASPLGLLGVLRAAALQVAQVDGLEACRGGGQQGGTGSAARPRPAPGPPGAPLTLEAGVGDLLHVLLHQAPLAARQLAPKVSFHALPGCSPATAVSAPVLTRKALLAGQPASWAMSPAHTLLLASAPTPHSARAGTPTLLLDQHPPS